jgi:hypothetical protein
MQRPKRSEGQSQVSQVEIPDKSPVKYVSDQTVDLRATRSAHNVGTRE